MLRLKCPLPHFVPRYGLLSAAEAAELESLDNAAKSITEWIVARKTDCEAECLEAYHGAVAEGYRTGLAAFADAVQAYNEAQTRMCEGLEQILESSLEELVGFCPKKDMLRACIASVLANGYDDEDLILRVAPEDVKDMEDALAHFRKGKIPALRISIEVSRDLQKGRCAFYTQTDVLTIDQEILVAQLLAALRGSGALVTLQTELTQAALDEEAAA